MTAAEAAIFERDPLFDMCKQLRRWDEGMRFVTTIVTTIVTTTVTTTPVHSLSH
jgi:hypothetical protein